MSSSYVHKMTKQEVCGVWWGSVSACVRRRSRRRPSQSPPHSPKKIKMEEEEDEDRVQGEGQAAVVGEARSSCKPAPASTRALAQPEEEDEEEDEEGGRALVALVAAGEAAATSSTEALTHRHTGTHACAQRAGMYVNMCAVYMQYSTHRCRSGRQSPACKACKTHARHGLLQLCASSCSATSVSSPHT